MMYVATPFYESPCAMMLSPAPPIITSFTTAVVTIALQYLLNYFFSLDK